MKKYTATWGHQNYWPKNNQEHLVHPGDENSLSVYWSSAIIFYCTGEENGFLIITKGNEQFRIKPELYKTVNYRPKFGYGDKLKELTPPYRIGEIEAIVWHFKRRKPYYILKIDGKIKTRWYFEEDLELASKPVYTYQWLKEKDKEDILYVWQLSGSIYRSEEYVLEYIKEKLREAITIKRNNKNPETITGYAPLFLKFMNTIFDSFKFGSKKYFYFKKSPGWEKPGYHDENPDFTDPGFEKVEWK